MSIKSFISEIFRSCLDILRDNEHLTGDKALRPLGYFLQLRLLEPQFGRGIDIDNYPYDFSAYEFPDKHRDKLLRLVRFSYLSKEVKEDDLVNNMKYLWDDILSVHPATKNVFLKGRSFEIKSQSTYKKIIDKLASFDFFSIDEDILGEVYEDVIKDVLIGKTLGQFFTPPKVKQLMVDLIDPKIHADGTTESVFDPAMGTGGFLITCLRNLIRKSKASGVKLDWDFITRNAVISGRECEPDTFQLAVSNMLISSGKMFYLEQGDSIRDPVTKKYDIILANPPFGIKGLEYDEITHPLRNTYMPISSKSSTPLFLQSIIYMLTINGRCAMVLPEGQDLFGKAKALVAVREYLLKTCDLKEVVCLPPGTFTHTTIKTCIFYFHKKREGIDALETKIKYSKTTMKETDRTYVFTTEHQTKKVIFSEFDGFTKRFIVEVGINEIALNNYSLNYVEYMAKDDASFSSDTVAIKTLGEICKDVSTSKNIPSSERVSGDYKFFTCSPDVGSHNAFFYEGSFIIQGSRGTIIGSTHTTTENEKFAIGTSMFISKVIDEDAVLTKYVYYYLKLNPSVFREHINGTAIPMINKANYYHIRIPIVSISKQREIVERLDFILETSLHTSRKKIQELRRLNELCFQTHLILSAPTTTLVEVCDFKNGKGIKKDALVPGEYPVIGGGKKPIGFHDKFNTDENVILCSSSGSAGYISKYDKKVWASDCFAIKPKAGTNLLNNYLYYFLKIVCQPEIYKMQTGTAQPHVYSKNLETMKIPFPSLEKQWEIAEFCDANVLLIRQLEKEIERNHNFAQQFVQSSGGSVQDDDVNRKRKHNDV
jgi:type I restriction-modification system DNA methylase subunit